MFENFDDLYDKFFNKNLGEDLNEPDKVVKFNKNGKTYEQRVWDLENGDGSIIVQLVDAYV